MPRHYQRTKNNPYSLPHNLYMRVLYVIRDYDRMKEEQRNLLHPASPEALILSARGKPGDPTASKAVKLAMMSRETEAIDGAMRKIPEEYRRGVWRNVVLACPFPLDADTSTYSRWRQRFIYHVAQQLEYH